MFDPDRIIDNVATPDGAVTDEHDYFERDLRSLASKNRFRGFAERVVDKEMTSCGGYIPGTLLCIERETGLFAAFTRPTTHADAPFSWSEYAGIRVSEFHRLINRVYRSLHTRKVLTYQWGDLFVHGAGHEAIFRREPGYFLPYYDAAALFFSLLLAKKRCRARQWLAAVRQRMIDTGRYGSDYDPLFVSLGWCLLRFSVWRKDFGKNVSEDSLRIPEEIVRGIIEKDIERLLPEEFRFPGYLFQEGKEDRMYIE